MSRQFRSILIVILVFFTSVSTEAQIPQAASVQRPRQATVQVLTFGQFSELLARRNLDLAAQRAGLPIAEAQITTARVVPDPVISAGIDAFDLNRVGSPTTGSVGITLPFELGGKRQARILAAQADLKVAQSDVEDFYRNLRATAANAYIDALSTRLVLDSKKKTLANLEKLVDINQERLRVGDIGEIALIQSRVEADQFRNDIVSSEADVRAADLSIVQLLGQTSPNAEVNFIPAGNLTILPREYDYESLWAQAEANRPDIISRRRALDAARAHIVLARANLKTEIDVTASLSHTDTATGLFVAPAFSAASVTVSVPLPRSRRKNPGELEAAIATEKQVETQLTAVELRARVEIRQALTRYNAAVTTLNLYTGRLLSDAGRVLEATMYGYAHSGATLLEVLEAQRKMNEITLAYLQAVTDHAHALVGVEQAVGIWDIQL